MSKLFDILLNNKVFGVLFLVLAASLAAGTFIENDYGTETARTLVYNAKWFEILLVWLCANFISQIFKYQLYQREKWAILCFHLGFVVTILGAGVTRYRGFEGMMQIAEGEKVDWMLSFDSYLHFAVGDGHYYENSPLKKMGVSEILFSPFSLSKSFKAQEVKASIEEYIPRAKNTFLPSKGGDD